MCWTGDSLGASPGFFVLSGERPRNPLGAFLCIGRGWTHSPECEAAVLKMVFIGRLIRKHRFAMNLWIKDKKHANINEICDALFALWTCILYLFSEKWENIAIFQKCYCAYILFTALQKQIYFFVSCGAFFCTIHASHRSA